MPFRVLVVSQYFWPENFRINELVSGLAARGNAVTVLTGTPNYPDGVTFPDFRQRPHDYDSYQGAELVRVPMLPRGRGSLRLVLNYLTFALSACAFGAWRLRKREFDAIFVFSPSPVTVCLPAILMRRLKRAPLVCWILDQWPETLAAVGVVKSPFVLRQVGRGVSFIYRRCDVLLAQSKSLVPLISKYTNAPHTVEYFPNWSDGLDSSQDPGPAPELPGKDGKFDVMFAGNIGESQDFGTILAAADLLRDETRIRWLIVGDGRMASWVRSEVERRGLTSQFLLLGRYPPERMPAFFRRSDALLVSLRAEPIFALTVPAKLQSYLAAGVPVVAMLNGEGGRIVEEAGAGFACPAGDAASLARAVSSLSRLPPETRAAMSERGRSYARQEFDRERLITGLEARLKSLSRKPRPGREG